MRQHPRGGSFALIPAAMLAWLISVGPGPATACAEDPPARPGERVRVTTVTAAPGTTHQDELEGILQSLDADGLTLLADQKPDAVHVPASAVRRLEISRGRHRPGWAMPTLVAGGALMGALSGAIVGAETQCDPTYGCASDEEVASSAGTGAWIGAAIGGAGGLIGALFIRQERWEPASLPVWTHPPKVSLGLMPVRRGVGLRIAVAF